MQICNVAIPCLSQVVKWKCILHFPEIVWFQYAKCRENVGKQQTTRQTLLSGKWVFASMQRKNTGKETGKSRGTIWHYKVQFKHKRLLRCFTEQ